MTRHQPEPDRAPDAASLVPWPLLAITRRLLARRTPPDLLLFYAEALEEAADHADATSLGTNPCARGLRDLAQTVRSDVPLRDDTQSESENADDPA